jgi:hypothetical protein
MVGTKQLDKKLLLYSAAVGAACVASGSAEAAIQYFSTPGGWTGTGTNEALLSFDLAGDVVIDPTSAPSNSFEMANFTSHGATRVGNFMVVGGISASVAGQNFKAFPGAASNIMNSDVPVQSAALLGANSVWATGSSQFGAWAPGTRAYLGLKFDDSGTPLYGWADVQMNAYDSITLFGYAYQDDGAPIHVPDIGTIPEPSTLALLALGAAGVAALRRRRQAI